jgi:hypothetical protein
MRYIVLFFVIVISALGAVAQKQTFDIVTHTPPANWKKEITSNSVVYSIINKPRWCQLVIYKNTTSKGSIEKDFESEWESLAATPLKITAAPATTAVQEAEGWKIMSGTAAFKFNNKEASTTLITFSGYGAMVSIQANTNSQDYMAEIQNFIESVDLYNGQTEPLQQNSQPAPPDPKQAGNSPSEEQPVSVSTGFKYTTTNFDDGWTGTEQADWVQVTKGNIKVLLHYPKEGTVFPADPDVLTTAAWNILVAPRYSNLKNYKTAYIATYNRPYLGMGYATENKTGKAVFVMLFRQGEGWIEFIAPDKNAFIQQYKFDPETIQWDSNSDLMNPLANMAAYNKFAVAASDFKGKWTSDFTGIQQLYNVYTGNYAGMNMNQSNEEFVFSGNNYNWKLLVINGMVGNAKFNQVKSSGKFSVVSNWKVHFTMIETRARTYHAFWSCIKGARILNLLDADYPGSGIYTKYGLAK